MHLKTVRTAEIANISKYDFVLCVVLKFTVNSVVTMLIFHIFTCLLFVDVLKKEVVMMFW